MTDEPTAHLIFPDTNVLMHGRPIAELPWDEFGLSDIDIVLAWRVMQEVDKLKYRDGRIGRTAKKWNSMIRDLMTAPDQAIVIRERGPRVRLRLLPAASLRAPVRDGLDLADGDHAIVNQAIARMDDGDNVMLLTNDSGCAITAAEFGVAARLLPEHWLRGPEADDAAKELARKDAEIARLRAAEPVPRLRFVDGAGSPIHKLEAVVPRYRPVRQGSRHLQRCARCRPTTIMGRPGFRHVPTRPAPAEIPDGILDRLIDLACYAA